MASMIFAWQDGSRSGRRAMHLDVSVSVLPFRTHSFIDAVSRSMDLTEEMPREADDTIRAALNRVNLGYLAWQA
jgi:hypothetical protein